MRLENERDHRRLIHRVLAERTGLVTLTPDADSTTIVDARIRYDSPIILIATTASAAAELAGGALHVSETDRANGSVVITHANAPGTDRTFRYLIG